MGSGPLIPPLLGDPTGTPQHFPILLLLLLSLQPTASINPQRQPSFAAIRHRPSPVVRPRTRLSSFSRRLVLSRADRGEATRGANKARNKPAASPLCPILGSLRIRAIRPFRLAFSQSLRCAAAKHRHLQRDPPTRPASDHLQPHRPVAHPSSSPSKLDGIAASSPKSVGIDSRMTLYFPRKRE